MNENLLTQARAFIAALPASVEMPAGTGKTHLLAAVVTELTALVASDEPPQKNRALVLTHTNAGVHAIRKRLDDFGARATIRVSTITSFAFELARAYPQLGGLEVPGVPNWANSASYIEAATHVSGSGHIRRVLEASFTHLLVDEYQDCTESQHEFVLRLTDAIPAAGVFGDRLQAIFGFADPLVSWSAVETAFPRFDVNWTPWRWKGHNESLGRWLVKVRGLLKAGEVFDFSAAALPDGVRFEYGSQDHRVLPRVAREVGTAEETVLILCGIAPEMVRATAKRLNGQYSAMEEIRGSYMRNQLTVLNATDPIRYGRWLADVAKNCFVGYGDLNPPVLLKLDKGLTVSHLKRDGLSETLTALDLVATKRNLESLAQAMLVLARAKEARLHSHEAWYDMLSAIRSASAVATTPEDSSLGSDSVPLLNHLDMIRNRLRHTGREDRRRIVSRTVLIKGLEYDHVIVANVDQITDACNLYVALSRARKTITVLGSRPQILITPTLTRPRRDRRSLRSCLPRQSTPTSTRSGE